MAPGLRGYGPIIGFRYYIGATGEPVRKERRMERTAWLREKRRAAEERMATLFASIYDDQWGATLDPSHSAMLAALLDRLPPGGRVLDVACGTGN